MSVSQVGYANIRDIAPQARNTEQVTPDRSTPQQNLAVQINATTNGFQQGLLLRQLDAISGGKDQTNQFLSGAQPLVLAQAKVPSFGIPATDFTNISTTSEFQKSFADGQFVGGNRDGGYSIFANKTLTPNVPYISPRDEITGSRLPERPNGSIIYTNGIDTTPFTAGQQAQTIANMTNNNLRVIYSNTNVEKQAGLIFNPNSTSPAILTASKEIQSAVKQNKPLHLYGHSGGATTIHNALNHAKAQLRADFGYNASLDTNTKNGDFVQHAQNKAIDAKIESKLRTIKVETSGSPVNNWPVDGPKYVHWVNLGDKVTARGIRYTEGGKNAVYVNFTSGSYFDGNKPHDLDRYLNVREDQGGFDKIYNQNSGKSFKTYPTNVNVQDSYKNR